MINLASDRVSVDKLVETDNRAGRRAAKRNKKRALLSEITDLNMENMETTELDLILADDKNLDLLAAYNYLYRLYLNGCEIDSEDWDDIYLIESDTPVL